MARGSEIARQYSSRSSCGPCRARNAGEQEPARATSSAPGHRPSARKASGARAIRQSPQVAASASIAAGRLISSTPGSHDEHRLLGLRGLVGQDRPYQPRVQRADQVGGLKARSGAMKLSTGKPDVLRDQHPLAAHGCVAAVDVQDVHACARIGRHGPANGRAGQGGALPAAHHGDVHVLTCARPPTSGPSSSRPVAADSPRPHGPHCCGRAGRVRPGTGQPPAG